ncbi:cephalosporin hydroxylase family protein [Aliiroseovarius sp. KMU-50]|uniref:Cephalosporin hydroxylase family protein n=1 Tax=Aliiroseovarius salicola TaxID=3009082 RepID=A0ABT4W5F9_9RHOB|nr:cephalosporin hydroxylase family protein [Aliiroseovarius sp. KMU-50]MDA5095741.1 cephalosporin hydroxylase family protein [Aliiroseovarius sp. KMU-50]
MADQEFENERREDIARMAADEGFSAKTLDWLAQAQERRYSYQFDWMGLPIIQYPQDIVAMQELVWSLKPDLIIETGIARGGSVIFYASLLELNAMCGGPGDAIVVAVDIDIRAQNRQAIEAHPMAHRLDLIEGSSIDPDVISQIREKVAGRRSVLVCLDSNHTHDHVLEELRAYGPLVTHNSYVVVFDTLIETLPDTAIGDRPWGPGDNPMTAVHSYLQEDDHFEIDHARHTKLQITVARNGYLKRVG